MGAQPRLSIQGATDEILRRGQAVPAGATYGQLHAPPRADLDELRRQQDAFKQVAEKLDSQNSWMAVPALAPAAAILGLEGIAAIASRFAAAGAAAGPLVFTERMPYIRVGDNAYTRAGRRADKAIKALAESKAGKGWTPEPHIEFKGKLLKPDVGAPARGPDPTVRRYIELKPNTPTGRAAAARQVKKYKEATGQNVRAMFYDPKKFM